MKVPFSNLVDEFRDVEEIDFRSVVEASDFTLGLKVHEFELRFADYIGVSYAIGVGSGTDAIKLSLKAAGVGPGDEVIVPAETFVATLGAVVEIGAVPVLVDVRDDFCIDPDLVKAAITERTKAIVPVHLTGEMCDMPAIMDIVRGTTIVVIEDVCQALGASLNTMADSNGAIGMKMAGAWGHLAAFSFHPMKNLCVWGDGGMIVTNDKDYAEKLRLLRNHGLAGRDRWECFGYNSRLDTIQAAVGLWMLPKLGEIVSNRQGNADYYNRNLALQHVELPREGKAGNFDGHACHLYMIRVADHRIRTDLLITLQMADIEAKVHYPTPLWQQPAMVVKFPFEFNSFPVAAQHAKTIISLPVHHHLTIEQLQYVCDTIRKFFGMERTKTLAGDELHPSPQHIHDVWERIYSKEDVELLDRVMVDLCRDFPNEWWADSEYAHLFKRLPRTGGGKKETPAGDRWRPELGVQKLVNAAVNLVESRPSPRLSLQIEDIRTALFKLGVPFKRP